MLAIVIPYYKINFFSETLDSLAKQTDKRFKVYIGDDASVENPSAILKKYHAKINFVYKRFENNIGSISLVKQWERCIDLTEDEHWIMILGDDDFLDCNVVEEFYLQFDKFNKNSNVVRYSTIVLDEKAKFKSEVFLHNQFETGLEFTLRKLRGGTRSSLSEYVFRKKIYMKHRFTDFPSAFYSDDKAWLDFAEDKFIYTINNAVVFIRISDFSLSGTVQMPVLLRANMYYLKSLFFNKIALMNKDDRIFILKNLEKIYYANNVTNAHLWALLYYRFLVSFNKKAIIQFHKNGIRKIIQYLKTKFRS